MKKFILIIIFFLALAGCDKEDAPDCIQSGGELVKKEVPVADFEELIVYGQIKLIIEQGSQQKVIIESGKNLIEEVTAEVENGRLSLKNSNKCNFFREYGLTTIYVTVPNLTWLQNAGNRTIESRGELHFPEIWLRSLNQEKDPEIYTNGDFRLSLFSEEIRVTTDNYSNFFLKGKTNYFDAYIADGDSRIEAGNLIAERVDVQHRGTNKLIVNPQEIIKGEIRSTGDVILINRPPVIDVKTFYTGKLRFR